MPRPPLLRRARAPLAALGLAGAALAVGADEAERSARPPAAAYVVIDGVRIDAPLAPAGDPARGRALFADIETGGCRACHAAPGLPATPEQIPRVLRDRFPPLPTAEPEAEAAEAPPAPRLVDATDRAPAAAPLPARRPAEADAAAEAAAAAPADEAEDAPPLLPLPPGPDLGDVAARLSAGEIRLMLVNPRLRDPAAVMPAYHHVSLPLARRVPALRQPWFSPQEIEDMVAWLAGLDGSGADPAAPAEGDGADAPEAPDEAETDG